MFIVRVNMRGEFEAQRVLNGVRSVPGIDAFRAESWYIFSHRLWEQLKADQQNEISAKASE